MLVRLAVALPLAFPQVVAVVDVVNVVPTDVAMVTVVDAVHPPLVTVTE